MAQMNLELVISSKLGADARAAFSQIQQMSGVGTRGNQQLEQSAKRAGTAIQGIGRQGKFARDVLEAFVFYRGFVVLQEGAMAATRELIELEKQVAIVSTQLENMAPGTRGDISQRIVEIGQKTGVAFSEIAKAEFEVVSANIALADSYEIVELAAKAAVAGGLEDVELAFNAALSQVNSFGLAVSEFDDVFDKQFNLIKRGIFTYEQFATVVGTVSVAFAGMGQDVETANAALAAISQVFTGKQIERGATGLRNAVLRLTEAPELFEELGVRVTDANGEFRNFIDIGRDLKVVLDQMSTSARARVIKDLFPDKREQRGINVFLEQLDEASQFYIEQQFAAGDLDEAFNKVNDTLAQQAHILANEVIPAFEPFVEVVDGLVRGINQINDDMPGFTSGLIQAAAAIAAIQAGFAFGPGIVGAARSGMGRMNPFPAVRSSPVILPGLSAQFGGAGMFGRDRTRFIANPRGIATIGAGAGIFGAGVGGIGGGAMAGAAIGSIGGLQGAALGLVVGGIAGGLADALKSDAPEVAASFSEQFAISLNAESKSVAQAFADAIGIQLTGAGGAGGGLRMGRAVFGGQVGSDEQREALMGVLRRGGTVTLTEESLGGLIERNREFGPDDIEALSQALDPAGFAISAGGTVTATTNSTPARFINEFGEFLKKMDESGDRLQVIADAEGLTLEELRASTLDQAIDDLFNEAKVAIGAEDAAVFKLFAQQVAEGEVKIGQFNQALSIYNTEGREAFLEFIGRLKDAGPAIEDAFEVLKVTFEDMASGDFAEASAVFKRMGDEGERLADVFKGIAETMSAFQTFETLRDTMIQNQFKVLETRSQSGDLISREFMSESILDALGLDSMVIGQMLTDRLKEQLGGVHGDISEESFVAALFGSDAEDDIKEPLELGATGLASALLEAADLVRGGFIDGLGHTADELEMMGEELTALNKLIRQKAIIEEIKSIAEFAGISTGGEGAGRGGLVALLDALRQQMAEGATNFVEMLSDPAKLAELLANMEFGDIEVDNSTNQTFTIRVSGDISEGQLGALQDAIVESINRANREATSR